MNYAVQRSDGRLQQIPKGLDPALTRSAKCLPIQLGELDGLGSEWQSWGSRMVFNAERFKEFYEDLEPRIMGSASLFGHGWDCAWPGRAFAGRGQPRALHRSAQSGGDRAAQTGCQREQRDGEFCGSAAGGRDLPGRVRCDGVSDPMGGWGVVESRWAPGCQASRRGTALAADRPSG